MRITNSIMINNSLNNINNNKVLLDKLNTQLSSEKKIQRPSEDPIVAIRALRFRSTLSEIDQYLEKNIPDARSWMEVTQDSLENTVGLLEDIVYYVTQGANGTNDTSDRQTVIDTLEQYRDQIYSGANADCAGRTIFTGYKTDSTLTFTEDEPDTVFAIKQNFTADDIANFDVITNSVDTGSINAGNVSTIDISTYETPNVNSVYRLRLGYNELQAIDDGAGGYEDVELSLYNKDSSGTLIEPPTTISANTISASDSSAYTPADGEVNFIAETGEYIFSKSAYTNVINYDQITVNYVKVGFDEGELKPEHFFDCYDMSEAYASDPTIINDLSILNDPDAISANNIIKYTTKEQDINYTVNFNQDIKINTQANEVFTHDMTRDMDDLIKSVSEVSDVENKISKLNGLLENETEGSDNYTKLQSLIELTNRELDFAKDNMQNMFESCLTTFQDHQERVSLAKADVGARLTRLSLNETRLGSQKLTVEELKTKNEDVVLTDIAVEISAAEDVYDASLAAAAKVVKNTLLDFI